MLDPKYFPDAESWYAAERERLRELMRSLRKAMAKEPSKRQADPQGKD